MKQKHLPLEHLPQHPGWGCDAVVGRKDANEHGQLQGGGHRGAGKLPSLALLLPAKSSGKKLPSFQILAKKGSPLIRWTQEYRINVEKPILRLCVL